MATWELEHLPVAGGSTRQSLTAWGFASAQATWRNWADGALVCTAQHATAFLADSPFSYRDKVILWRDGVRVYHGWLSAVTRRAAPEADTIDLVFSDPWWWLANTPMRAPRLSSTSYAPLAINTPNGTIYVERATATTWITPDASEITWPSWWDQSTVRVQGQIRRALYAAIWAGAPIAIGAIAIDAVAPEQDPANATCAGWIQGAARYIPFAAMWWDFSGVTPVFHCCERSALAAASVDLLTGNAASGIAPLNELQAHAVRIRYRWTPDPDATGIGYGDGNEYAQDSAGSAGYPEGPNCLVADVPVDGYTEAYESKKYAIAAKLYGALSPLAYAGSVAIYDGNLLRPGTAINVTGGRTEWASMAAVVQGCTLDLTVDTADLVTVEFGAPSQLGVMDFVELARLTEGGASTSGDDRPAGETGDPVPGTFDDLNSTPPAQPAGAIAVETLGGPWSKCGFGSYNGTEPTRRWLRADSSFSVNYDCGPRGGLGSASWATNSVYNPENCAGGPTGGVVLGWDVEIRFCYPLSSWIKTATTATAQAVAGNYTSFGACCPSDYPFAVISGSANNVLTNEDTEDAAFDRTLDAAEWNNSTTEGIRTIPVTIASGIRRKLRFGTYVGSVYTPLTGLAPWRRYRLVATIELRPVNELGVATGSWVASGEAASQPWIASVEGKGGSEWVEVEPTAGYATRLTNLKVEEY